MMSTTKVEAIKCLQEKLRKLTPGSYWFEVYEKALDLALNPIRKEDEFFYRNLLRDAKRILKRQKRPSIVSQDENERSLDSLIDSGLSPLNKIIFKSYIDQITEQCKNIHPFATDVFADLLDGIHVKVTAEKLYVSESQVKKLRIRIRQVSHPIIYN